MNRRTFLESTVGIVLIGSLAGCTGSGESTGTLATYVSDQPGDIDDFESCVVTITEIRIKPVDGELIRESVDDVQADLVQLQGNARKLVDESELAEGEYEHVHLSISDVDATLAGGGEAMVDTAGEAGLKFQTFVIDGEQSETFEVRAGETTTFTADFMPVKQGQTNRYILKPVADEVRIVYGVPEG
jgi:hypothetical protein